MSLAPKTTPEFTDEPILTPNARKVLEARYLKKDEQGRCLEKPSDLYRRVAKTIAAVETQYGSSSTQRQLWEDRFYSLLSSGRFMPNSPTLMNAGREMGMLSACFVLPVRDSIIDIFNTIKHTALIQKAGGGTGFAFDELRPTGDFIKSSGGTTSGPISFWRAFSEATSAIQQGAFRRGANMGMMYIHHPDILKFLHAKQKLDQFTNYNISVKVTDAWMKDFEADPDSPHLMRNPRNGKAFVIRRDTDIWKYNIQDLIEVDCVDPVAPNSRETYFTTPSLQGDFPDQLRGKVYTKRDIWDIIVNNAWQTGEPGVVFIDRVNDHNPTPQLGRIEATNPCGEQPLLPYEACNLGSLNLGSFVRNGESETPEVDWDSLRGAIDVAVRFLDNVIDANNYPLREIERICHDNRKIGLGVMGFADALYKLGVPYNSEAGIEWGERFMKFINDEAHNSSEQLARERGCFPNWQGSTWHTRENRVMRNAAVTTIAPTGTISIIANCSGGIEPLFSLAFMRNVLRDHKQGRKPMIEVNDAFLEVANSHEFHSDELIERIAREGTIAKLDEIPAEVRRVFVCAHDIAPDWHMRMQAAFQRHCDASISKTINFPNDATREDVAKIYIMAHDMGCKGVTVYRDGCRPFQPMELKKDNADSAPADAPTGETKRREMNVSEVLPKADAARATVTEVVQQTPVTEPTPALARSHCPVMPRIEPMDLPEIVSGLRIRQMTPFGNMHVKITVDPRADRDLEVFAQLGKGGDVANSDLEAICRMVSLWLRSGGSLRLVVKQLEGIGSSLQIPTRAGRITSLGDGLACALKKYLRAKERFGLHNLLLGEINLAELDNPNPAPHRPATTPVDRPIGPPKGGNGGNGGNGGSGTTLKSAAASSPAAVTRLQPDNRTQPSDSHRNPSRASTVARAATDQRSAHGANDGCVAIAQPATEAQAEADERVEAVALLEMHAETTILDPIEETSAQTAQPEPLSIALDLSSVAAEVRHTHDSASHYKVMCPECGGGLMLQEGCRKCPGCGWSAC